jgi:SLOG cluster3 family
LISFGRTGAIAYQAGVLIGGMEGVEEEFALFKQSYPKAAVLPIASTGGAALLVYKTIPGLSSDLLTSLDYIGLVHRGLGVPPSEKRQLIP